MTCQKLEEWKVGTMSFSLWFIIPWIPVCATATTTWSSSQASFEEMGDAHG